MSAGGLTSEWTPRLLDMEAELSRDLPNEPEAILRVARTIRKMVCLWNTSDRPRPLGKFLVLGRNEEARKLANSLARFLFGDQADILVLHLAERDVFGYLTEQVRRRPETVAVLEGVENMDPNGWPPLIQILEGVLTDDEGRAVSFRDSIILVTTAVGYQEGGPRPGWVKGPDGTVWDGAFPTETRQVLQGAFPSELLRLIDDILVFR